MNVVGDIRESRLAAYRTVPRDILSHYRDEEAEKRNYVGRPLYELLQNAEDAMASLDNGGEVLIGQHEGALYIANHGAPFSRVGLESLCDRSISPKRGLDFIGSKGIGFKAALNWTDAPRIISGGVCAEFSRARSVALIKDALSERQLSSLASDHRWTDDQVPLLRLPFDHEPDRVESRLIKEGWTTVVTLPLITTKLDEVASTIAGFDRRCLVFLRHIRELRLECDSLKGSIRVDRKQKTKRRSVVAISDGTASGQNIAEYWLFRKPLEIRPADTKELGKAEVAAAVPIAEADKAGNALYNFFPTLTAAPAPRLLLHATFLLTPDRNNLRSGDTEYHDALFTELIELVTEDALPALSRKMGARVLSYLRLAGEAPAHNAPLKRFWSGLKQKLSDTKFVHTLGAQLAAPKDSKLWRHGLDQVVTRGNRKASLNELTAADWQAGEYGKALIALGAEDLDAQGHLSILEDWEAAAPDDSVRAIDLLFSVATAAKYSTSSLAPSIDVIGLWLTNDAKPRPLGSTVPLFESVPKSLPRYKWLSFDELDDAVLQHWTQRPGNDYASQTLKQMVGRKLCAYSAETFADRALAPALKDKSSNWWLSDGADVLGLIRVLGLKAQDDFVWRNATRSKLSRLVHLPSKGSWHPAWKFYAGRPWESPVGHYLASALPDRYRLAKPGAPELRGVEKDNLLYLGVSWGPKALTGKTECCGYKQGLQEVDFGSQSLQAWWKLYAERILIPAVGSSGIGSWTLTKAVGYEGIREAADVLKTHSRLMELLRNLFQALPPDTTQIEVKQEGPQGGGRLPFVSTIQDGFVGWQISSTRMFPIPASALLSEPEVAIRESFLNSPGSRAWRRWLPVIDLDDLDGEVRPQYQAFAISMGARATFANIHSFFWLNWLGALQRRLANGAELSAKTLGGFLHDMSQALQDEDLSKRRIPLPVRRSATTVDFAILSELYVLDQTRFQSVRTAVLEAGVPLLVAELEDGRRIARIFGARDRLLSSALTVVLDGTVDDGNGAKVSAVMQHKALIAALISALASRGAAEKFADTVLGVQVYTPLHASMSIQGRQLGVHPIPFIVDRNQLCVDSDAVWDNVAHALISWLDIRSSIEDALVRLFELLDAARSREDVERFLAGKGITSDSVHAWEDRLGIEPEPHADELLRRYAPTTQAEPKSIPAETPSQQAKEQLKKSEPRERSEEKRNDSRQEPKNQTQQPREEYRRRETDSQQHSQANPDDPNKKRIVTDRRTEKGQAAEDWFVASLPGQLPTGWRLTKRGGGPSPFDVEIQNGSVTIYIEVKTDSGRFIITENEVDFAREKAPFYAIALVADDNGSGIRELRWLFRPLKECAEWITGGIWVHNKEAPCTVPIAGWRVPVPRPAETITAPSFRFQITVPTMVELPTAWQPLLSWLSGAIAKP